MKSFLMISPMLISSLFCLVGFHVAMADEGLIKYTCSKTPYPDVCISALKSDPKSFNADTGNLGAIIVNQYSSKTKQAFRIVNNSIKHTTDPKVVQALARCAEYYNVVITATAPSAFEAFTKGNPKFAEDGANDARLEAESCEAGFPRGMSPVSRLNREIGQLGAVAASIARSLE